MLADAGSRVDYESLDLAGTSMRTVILLLRMGAAMLPVSPAVAQQPPAGSMGERVLPRNTHRSIPDLVKTIDIPASLDSVWWAWTTVEGITSFFAPRARIDFRIGGVYELYFRDDQPPGSQGSEGVKILSYEPRRCFRSTGGLRRSCLTSDRSGPGWSSGWTRSVPPSPG